MREIKFRAFNKELKKMIYPDKKGWFNRVIRSKKSGVIQTVGIDLLIRGDYPEVEVQQYTGLKDKNGVDIYESDFVKCKIYGNEEIGLVQYSDNLVAYFLTEMGRSDTELWGCSEKEVIGNIYENSELLEESK